MVLYGLDKYISYCTKFAWCMVCQVPPPKIEYNNTVYNSRSHSLSPAFSSLEDYNSSHCPIYPETQQSVRCYLWPTLQDSDGRVLVKGEVILKDNWPFPGFGILKIIHHSAFSQIALKVVIQLTLQIYNRNTLIVIYSVCKVSHQCLCDVLLFSFYRTYKPGVCSIRESINAPMTNDIYPCLVTI